VSPTGSPTRSAATAGRNTPRKGYSTRDEQYLRWAEQSFTSYLLPVEKGGFTTVRGGATYF
jgi:hypothetical protein